MKDIASQILEVAVDMLNKQSGTADREWPSSFGGWAGEKGNNTHRKKKSASYKMFNRALNLE
jgi:hypothetical protein